MASKHIKISIADYQAEIPVKQWHTHGITKKGYVYIITDGDAVKIGQAQDVDRRVSSIQCSNPRSLTVLEVISTNDMGATEKALHEYFKDYLIQGEWFDLLPVFGIRESYDEQAVALQHTINDMKKEMSRLKIENARWRSAKYGGDDRYCSHCGHALERWFEDCVVVQDGS